MDPGRVYDDERFIDSPGGVLYPSSCPDFLPETSHSRLAGYFTPYGPSQPQLPSSAYSEHQIELGSKIFDELWPTISGATARTTGIQPMHSVVNRFGDPEFSVNMPVVSIQSTPG